MSNNSNKNDFDDKLKKLKPYKLDISVKKLTVNTDNKGEEDKIKPKDLENAYLNDNYYVVKEIDFSGSSIPLEKFTNSSLMTQALIKETEKFIGALSIFDKNTLDYESGKKKETINLTNNISFLLRKIFDTTPTNIAELKTKYSISSFKWANKDSFKEDIYEIPIDVELVITSITGISGFDGARRFCSGNKASLRSAIRKFFQRNMPIVKPNKRPVKEKQTNYKIRFSGGKNKKIKNKNTFKKKKISGGKQKKTIRNNKKRSFKK